MTESFSEYKKTLDGVLNSVNYLYSGDIISSEIKKFKEVKNTSINSVNFILDCLHQIYDLSFYELFDKSSQIIIPTESINESSNLIDQILSKLDYSPHYIFCSQKSSSLLGININYNNIKPLPSYFYHIDRFVGLNLDVCFCPLIAEKDDDVVLFVSDAAIQSLVYTIQNMEYLINRSDEDRSLWQHEMVYNFYNCKYKSDKIIIRNISTIRESKINQIFQ